ncbi:MAG TPA: hypothetical protein DD856_06870 [Sulfobacillus sp.]|nr:hypothetical protein [Sulfobacillus sp.]
MFTRFLTWRRLALIINENLYAALSFIRYRIGFVGKINARCEHVPSNLFPDTVDNVTIFFKIYPMRYIDSGCVTERQTPHQGQ